MTALALFATGFLLGGAVAMTAISLLIVGKDGR